MLRWRIRYKDRGVIFWRRALYVVAAGVSGLALLSTDFGDENISQAKQYHRLQDSVAAVIRSTTRKVSSAAAALHTAGRQVSSAWAQRDTAPLKVLATSWVADWCVDGGRRRLAAALGGDAMLDWLLVSACAEPSALQSEAERAVTQLLQPGGDTAALLLGRPGAVPLLLTHLADGSASDELWDCFNAACNSYGSCGSCSSIASGRAHHQHHQRQCHQDIPWHHRTPSTPSTTVTFDGFITARGSPILTVVDQDVKEVLSLVAGSRGIEAQVLASKVVAWWAASSQTNRLQLHHLGIHQVLTEAVQQPLVPPLEADLFQRCLGLPLAAAEDGGTGGGSEAVGSAASSSKRRKILRLQLLRLMRAMASPAMVGPHGKIDQGPQQKPAVVRGRSSTPSSDIAAAVPNNIIRMPPSPSNSCGVAGGVVFSAPDTDYLPPRPADDDAVHATYLPPAAADKEEDWQDSMLSGFVQPSLLIAAEAAAAEDVDVDSDVVADAIHTLSKILRAGSTMTSNAIAAGGGCESLLQKIWEAPGDEGSESKAEVALMIGAMASKGLLNPRALIHWADQLLDSFCTRGSLPYPRKSDKAPRKPENKKRSANNSIQPGSTGVAAAAYRGSSRVLASVAWLAGATGSAVVSGSGAVASALGSAAGSAGSAAWSAGSTVAWAGGKASGWLWRSTDHTDLESSRVLPQDAESNGSNKRDEEAEAGPASSSDKMAEASNHPNHAGLPHDHHQFSTSTTSSSVVITSSLLPSAAVQGIAGHSSAAAAVVQSSAGHGPAAAAAVQVVQGSAGHHSPAAAAAAAADQLTVLSMRSSSLPNDNHDKKGLPQPPANSSDDYCGDVRPTSSSAPLMSATCYDPPSPGPQAQIGFSTNCDSVTSMPTLRSATCSYDIDDDGEDCCCARASFLSAACVRGLSEMCCVEGVDGLRVAHRWLARMLLHLAEEVIEAAAAAAASTATTSSTTGGAAMPVLPRRSAAAAAATARAAMPVLPSYAKSVALSLDAASFWASAASGGAADAARLQIAGRSGSRTAGDGSPASRHDGDTSLSKHKQQQQPLQPQEGNSDLLYYNTPVATTTDVTDVHQSNATTGGEEVADDTSVGTYNADDVLPFDLSDPLGAAPDIVGRQVEAAKARRKERLKREGPARAEQSSCDALEVLNLVVAQDTHRTRWLHTAGVLPLMERLLDLVPEHYNDSIMSSSPLPDEVVKDRARAAAMAGTATNDNNSSSRSSHMSYFLHGVRDNTALPNHDTALQSATRRKQKQHLLGMKRQAARMLAQLALLPEAATYLSSNPAWLSWLMDAAEARGIEGSGSGDLRLASHATKALLHLRRALSMMNHESGPAGNGHDGCTTRGSLLSTRDRRSPGSSFVLAAVHQNADRNHYTSDSVAITTSLPPQLDRGDHNHVIRDDYEHHCSQVPSQHDMLQLGDMIHLLHPSAPHHATALHLPTVLQACRSTSPAGTPTHHADQQGHSWQGQRWSRYKPDVGPSLPSSQETSSSNDRQPAVATLLIRRMSAAAAVDEPELDIVFLHGIRGGPFITWRKGTTPAASCGTVTVHSGSEALTTSHIGDATPTSILSDSTAAEDRALQQQQQLLPSTSSSTSVEEKKGIRPTRDMVVGELSSVAVTKSSHLPASACWPSDWLSKDYPSARLLAVEYPAPYTGWECESLPLEETAHHVLSQLLAAGVGQRPVMFVCHSMGGLLIKEVISVAVHEAAYDVKDPAAVCHGHDALMPVKAFLDQMKAVAFFATPHFGSNLAAMGWKLRALPGARPAPSLARLAPGPHLYDLNELFKFYASEHDIRVVSLLEGMTTDPPDGLPLPKMIIVSPEVGYPGIGEVVMLHDKDHTEVCKPSSRSDMAYLTVRNMVGEVLDEHIKAGGSKAAGQVPNSGGMHNSSYSSAYEMPLCGSGG